MRTCLAAGLPVRVSHVVGAPNINGVEDFVRDMIDLGVDRIVVNTVFPAGRAEHHPALALTPPQLADLEPRLDTLRRLCRSTGVDLDYSIGQPVTTDAPRGCPAGTRVLYIAADGTVSGCSWLYKIDPGRFGIGNLHHEPFSAMTQRLGAQNDTFAAHESCPLPTLAKRP